MNPSHPATPPGAAPGPAPAATPAASAMRAASTAAPAALPEPASANDALVAERPGGGLRILLLDNYDSFTFNLYQYLAELGAEVEVVRNDEIAVEDVAARGVDGIVISPGPSRPENAGISVPLVERLGEATPILGVCLGHQAIGLAFGGRVVQVEPVHGKRSPVEHRGEGCFSGLPSPLDAGRYHSLAIGRDSVPGDLEVTAWSPDGLVMGVRHRRFPIEGIQFHPESILTPEGMAMLANWLREVRGRREQAGRP
jgi:anthranilate synthase/aminodeoxychorismate synthase-like glutamine amidotransferase